MTDAKTQKLTNEIFLEARKYKTVFEATMRILELEAIARTAQDEVSRVNKLIREAKEETKSANLQASYWRDKLNGKR